MTPLKITTNNRELLIVVVPKDVDPILYQYKDRPIGKILHFFKNGTSLQDLLLPEGNWQIIGPIKKEGDIWTFGFDPEPYVENTGEGEGLFRMYTEPDYVATVCAGNSFVSLIESTKELYFENPITEPNLHESYDSYFQRKKLIEDKVINDHQILVLENVQE